MWDLVPFTWRLRQTNTQAFLSQCAALTWTCRDKICLEQGWNSLIKEVLHAQFGKPRADTLMCVCFMYRCQEWSDLKNTVFLVLYKTHHTQLCVDDSNLWLISISGSPLRCITKWLQDLFPWQQQHHTGKRMERVQKASLEIATKMHTQLRRLKTNPRHWI